MEHTNPNYRQPLGVSTRNQPMAVFRSLSLIFLMLTVLLAGCEPEIRVVRSSWDNFPADPKPSQTRTPRATRDPAGGQGWAIELMSFTGPQRHHEAMRMSERLREEAGLGDVWIEDTGDTARLYHGRFASATDPQLRSAVNKIKRIELDGAKPFADSRVVPLLGQGRVIADPFDLRQFVGYYSLQIGFYDQSYGDNFREAAEQAVRALREDGHEAYYYHGPFRSIITVGLFTYDEAFVNAGTYDTYSPAVRELQKQFPYNLGNGVTLIQKENGKVIGEQKSSLVRVF